MYKGVEEAGDRLRALAVDSETCFLYWREGATVRQMAEMFGVDRWEAKPRRLRIASKDGTAWQVDCPAPVGSVYLDKLAAGTSYRVEYGVRLEERFVPLLAAEVQTPGQGVRSFGARGQHEAISSYTIYSQG